MTPDAHVALTFLADLDGCLLRGAQPVPGSEECYSGIDVPTRVVRAAGRALLPTAEAFDALHIESLVNEWFAPLGFTIQQSHIDGLCAVLRKRLSRMGASGLNVPERAPGEFSEYMAETMPMKESAGESVDGIAVPSADLTTSLSPVGTAPRLPTERLDRCFDCGGSGFYPSAARCKSCDGTGSVAHGDGEPPPPAELGLETTEEERAVWNCELPTKLFPPGDKVVWANRPLARLVRDIDRLVAEVARLTDAFAKEHKRAVFANASIAAREATARAEERERDAVWHDKQAGEWDASAKLAQGQSSRDECLARRNEHQISAAAIRARTP